MAGFTAFDIGVAVIMAISLFTGFSRGFTREVFILLAWAGAAFVTVLALPYTAGWAAAILPWEAVADIAAMALTFFLALWILSAVGKRLSESIKTSFVAPLDRGLGALFGIARGAFIVSLAYIALGFFMPGKDGWAWVEKARFKNAAAAGAEFVTAIAPDLFETAGKAVGAAKDVEARDLLSGLQGLLPGNGADEESGKYDDRAREELDELIEETADGDASS